MSNSIVYTVKGKLWYPKILSPVDNFGKDGKEYVVSVTVTDEDVAKLESLGIEEQVFNPSANRMQSRYKPIEELGGRVLTVRRKVKLDEDGEMISAPLAVVGLDGSSKVTELIGNGSEANVQLFINSFTDKTGKERKKMVLGAVQVTELVSYKKDLGFEDLSAKKGDII